jgi:hypothetical protein
MEYLIKVMSIVESFTPVVFEKRLPPPSKSKASLFVSSFQRRGSIILSLLATDDCYFIL